MNEEINTVENKNKKSSTIFIITLLIVVVLAFVTAGLVKHFVIETYIVDGISMWPTIDGGGGEFPDSDRENGEVLYLNKTCGIKRNDIIVFKPEWDISAKDLVKRVIAIGGDHLQIIDNKVYLNGNLLNETYINEQMITNDLDVYIKDGNIFCMGDNRNHSTDCRVFGQISLDKVVGKTFLIKSSNGKLRKP